MLFVVVAMGAMAVPAKPGPIVITEADGTEQVVYIHGDEHFHYMTTPEGQWVEMREGSLHKVQGLTADEVEAQWNARREERIPRRVATATNMAMPLNIAPKGLIILVQFSDLSFQPANTLAAFQSMFNGDEYSFNGATGSAKKYFKDQSFGQYVPEFDVVGPVTVSQPQKYYGANNGRGNDQHPEEMIIEACQIADTMFNVDFTQYDNDNNGYIDFVYVLYAGRGEADGGGSSTIWPHTSWIYQGYGKTIRLDGKLLDTYACSNELQSGYALFAARDGIGAFCHEFGHVLGLSDHYATNSNSLKQMGNWDIMCSGSYNNSSHTPAGYTAYERFFCGWGKPVLLNEPITCDSMKPINTSGEMYIITSTGTSNLVGNDPNPATFYLLENRQKTGWDGYIPGHGLLLTCVRYSYNRWIQNTINNYKPLGYEIIEADGKEPTQSGYEDNGYKGKQGDVFPAGSVNSTTSFTTDHPIFETYPISDIQENDQYIHFKFMGGYDAISPRVKTEAAERYGDDFTEIVALYDISGRLLSDNPKLNELTPGLYIVAVSNGKKSRGIKIYIKQQ